MVSVVVALSLLRNSVGYAQEPGEPAPPPAPEVQIQGNNVAPPQPPGPPRYSGPVVTLRADNPRARLQILGESLRWRDVCTAPCNVSVQPAGSYRVGGGTIRGSDTFTMPRASGPVLVSAETGSNVKHWVGIGMIIAGIADAAGGALYYSSASTFATSSSNTSGLSKQDYQTIGIVGIISGLVVAAIGIPLAMSSTSVEVR
jgi:hypothetical protein